QQDAVLPGTSVTLTSTSTGMSRLVVTNESGLYQFSALPPGKYEMKVELTGFRAAQLTGIELRVDTQSRGDVKLALGPVSESVSVLAESPLINTTDARMGNTLNEESIRNLPVKSRNVVKM